ncbi:MAG: 2-C-methyl-D-erythritol 4-phosphate cytidylyltransferase [Neisseriaceae bacterium]
MAPQTVALIPAAGKGVRFGAQCPKQYLEIERLPILLHTLKSLSIPQIDAIYVVVATDDHYVDLIRQRFPEFWSTLIHQANSPAHRVEILRMGGIKRSETVFNALTYLLKEAFISQEDWLLVHDAARCCLRSELLLGLLGEVSKRQQGGLLAQKITDTVKEADIHFQVKRTLNREFLWLAQTPQIFKVADLVQAYSHTKDWESMTDEASLIESTTLERPFIFPSDTSNVKVTTQEDFLYAQFLLSKR